MGIFAHSNEPKGPEVIKSETNGGDFEDRNGYGGGSQDEVDMARMGKRQETRRNFGLITMLGFTTTMMCTWESALPFFVTAFLNGGPVTMIYGYIFAFFGSLATCASMAEMASMYPISGGQYHWVALLAPPRYSKFLSWLTGWVSTIGWQAATATGTYLGGGVIQGLLALNDPSYEPKRWQGTLLLYAVLLITVFVNTVLSKFLPALEGLILIFHILGFFAILITLVHLAPISSASYVFGTFQNFSGYSSDGVSWLVGLTSSAILFIGYDGACHMAEEVENAAVNVPRAMFFTIFINGAMGFAMYIVILFCIGDPQTTLSTPTGWPFIQIFYTATQSKAGTTVMTSILVAMYIFATFGFLASASRQAWAFARDFGLPGSRLFQRVDPKWAIPLWSILLTSVINALLGLINIGSTVAFNAVVSLVVSGYFSSYLLPIIFMALKRFSNEPPQLGPWNMGKFGLPVNIFAICFTILTLVFSFFPPGVPVTAQTMNWAIAVWGGTIVFGIIYYVLRGHKKYKGPLVDREYLNRT